MFYRSVFFSLPFIVWPMCCLPFFDLQLLISPLVSSNFLITNDIATVSDCCQSSYSNILQQPFTEAPKYWGIFFRLFILCCCWVYNQNVEWKLAKLEFFWWSTKLKTRWYQLHTSSDIDEGNSLQAFFSKDIIAASVLFSFRASATKSNTVSHTKQVSGLLTGFPEIKKIIY